VKTSSLSNSRVMCEIERTLGRGAGIPHIKHSKGKAERHKREIQDILDILKASSSCPDEKPSTGELAHRLAPVGPEYSVAAAVSESGMTFAMYLSILYKILTVSTSPTSTP